MLQAINVSLQYGSRVLFKDVNLKFTKGNCYGVIGANGAGKSTFLKILSGVIEPNKGEVIKDKDERLSVLNQDQYAFDNETVIRTVLLGNKRLVDIMDEQDMLYSKPDFSEEDGIKVGELQMEFAELNGWEAESDAKILLNGLGISDEKADMLMKDLDSKEKVKVLLAQALFGNPDILILDEPTNNLDVKAITWLENFLMNFENTVIVVSHDRYFLNKVCTHICDVDYGEINIFVGNYDFWYETNELLQRQAKEVNKKMEARAKELQEFIARFSANLSKSKQATSRKKELEKLTLQDLKVSSRRYPFVDFRYDREIGNDILFVENLTKKGYFENLSFTVNKNDKIAFVCENSLVLNMLFDVLMGVEQPDSGSVKWGKTITTSYLPANNDKYFKNCDLSLINWLKQYSKDQTETFIRGWLGRMLFSGEEALKQAKVISGGEKVRCMLAKEMLSNANVLVMNDPSNHLDLETITSLNKGMINFKGNILFTSHDHEITNTVANRIIEIKEENKVFDKYCTYDEYLEV
jgi:ATPase subunit of ABC transporter with duplicated ATPase domains